MSAGSQSPRNAASDSTENAPCRIAATRSALAPPAISRSAIETATGCASRLKTR